MGIAVAAERSVRIYRCTRLWLVRFPSSLPSNINDICSRRLAFDIMHRYPTNTTELPDRFGNQHLLIRKYRNLKKHFNTYKNNRKYIFEK